MEISYLREFVALAQTCQFQETAEELFISQSALSKHIKIIEKELGAELFIRTTRRVELSDVGRAFLSYASQIAMLQQDYTQELVRSDLAKKINICSDATVSMREIEHYLAAYAIEHPTVGLEIFERDKLTARSLLRKGEADIIIGCRDLSDTDSEFGIHPYYEDELVAVLSPHNPLYKRDCISIDEVKGFPLVQNGSLNFAQFLNPAMPSPQYKSVRGSFIVNILNQTNAISVAPSNVALYLSTNDIARDLKIVKLEPEIKIYVDILYLKIRENTPFIQSIIEHIDGSREVLSKQQDFDISASKPPLY